MVNISGSDEETISFSKPVKATGNIEDWLGALEKGMQVRIVPEIETEVPKFDPVTVVRPHRVGYSALRAPLDTAS